MKTTINLILTFTIGLALILGCSGAGKNTSTSAPASNQTTANSATNNSAAKPAETEKPIAVQSKSFTKEYEENELAADKKYKGKQIAVTGKITNIAETLGNLTVSLEGHNVVLTVMCSFEQSEKDAIEKLKKGQQVTLVGTGDGMTAGLYTGLQKCKIQ